MNSFKRFLGIIEPEPVKFIHWGPAHENLTDKQILYLEQMVENHRKRGMSICRCDVQRVLDMCKEGESI